MRKLTHNISKRLIFAGIILLIIIPTFVLTYFGNMPGRIIGMVIFMSIGVWGVSEVAHLVTPNKITPWIFSLLLIIPPFLLPWKNFIEIIRSGSSGTITGENSVDLRQLIFLSFTWEIALVPLFAIAIFLVIDPKIRENSTMFWKSLTILTVFSYITIFFAKGVWIINIFSWTQLIFVLSIPVISDTFAYFGGMLFGKKLFNGAKLAPKISPKKTWAGFVIGLVVTIPFAILVGYYINFWISAKFPLTIAILGGISLAVLAQMGDLLFSFFKRIFDIKDFSNVISVHGGIFDRLDSISVVVFFVVLLFLWF